MICFSGDWKKREDADRLLELIDQGATVVMHPTTRAQLWQVNIEFDVSVECEFVEVGKIYAIKLPEYSNSWNAEWGQSRWHS